MPDLDEDTLRQLMARSTDDLFAPTHAAAAAIKRQRRRRLRTRVLSVAGTAAAAGLAVGTIASSQGGSGGMSQATPRGGSGSTSQATPIRLTAKQTLLSLSAAAAAAPRPAGRYVAMAEKTFITYVGGGNGSADAPKTSVIDTINGSIITYQDYSGQGSSSGTTTPPAVLRNGPGSVLTVAQLDALPTDPTALRAKLLAWGKQQQSQDNSGTGKLDKGGEKDKLDYAPAPALVFEQAANLLWIPDLSADLRAAVYKVLATTQGVTVTKDAADSSGRPAVEISRRDTDGYAVIATFENPLTGATLESLWNGAGQIDEDLYQSITYSNTIPPDPYQG